MDTIKSWFINVAAKQMIPSLVRAGLAAGTGLLVAHAGLLAGCGIIYDKVGGTITIHLGALQDWLVTGGLGAITAILAALQHHTVAAVTGAPQDGSHPREADVPKAA